MRSLPVLLKLMSRSEKLASRLEPAANGNVPSSDNSDCVQVTVSFVKFTSQWLGVSPRSESSNRSADTKVTPANWSSRTSALPSSGALSGYIFEASSVAVLPLVPLMPLLLLPLLLPSHPANASSEIRL